VSILTEGPCLLRRDLEALNFTRLRRRSRSAKEFLLLKVLGSEAVKAPEHSGNLLRMAPSTGSRSLPPSPGSRANDE
jgi:hypothetical protein